MLLLLILGNHSVNIASSTMRPTARCLCQSVNTTGHSFEKSSHFEYNNFIILKGKQAGTFNPHYFWGYGMPPNVYLPLCLANIGTCNLKPLPTTPTTTLPLLLLCPYPTPALSLSLPSHYLCPAITPTATPVSPCPYPCPYPAITAALPLPLPLPLSCPAPTPTQPLPQHCHYPYP